MTNSGLREELREGSVTEGSRGIMHYVRSAPLQTVLRWGALCGAGALVMMCLMSTPSQLQTVPPSGESRESGRFHFSTMESVASESGETYHFGASLARSVGGLLICLGIFAAGVQIFRRYALKNDKGSRTRLTIVERLTISPKSTLHLLSLDGKEFIVATGADKPQIILNVRDLREHFDETMVASVDAEADHYSRMVTSESREVSHA